MPAITRHACEGGHLEAEAGADVEVAARLAVDGVTVGGEEVAVLVVRKVVDASEDLERAGTEAERFGIHRKIDAVPAVCGSVA